MDSAEQVVFVLQLILVLGPLAVYFLGLGLVNSLARPCLVNARVDFLILTVAFVPIILVPVLSLVEHGHALVALGVVLVIAALFCILLPERRTRWVIYNCSFQQCRRMMDAAARRLGWSLAMSEDRARFGPLGLSLHVATVPWLRNVTIRWAEPSPQASELLHALHDEMSRESMLPSPAGASLVVIGAGLLGVPMWYLLHHIDAVVNVVRHILFA